MPKGTIRDLHHGKEVWKPLEHIINRGKDRSRVFLDWLDVMLASYLSLTDNLPRPDCEAKLKANRLDGPFEDRYMNIVARYKDEKSHGERAIDLFQKAYHALVKETEMSGADVLGELYETMISYGEHGQFFTPEHVSKMMTMVTGIKDGERVLDPACGSGRMLLQAAKVNPNAVFYGIDVDERCAKMCVINFILFNLHGEVTWGDALRMKVYRRWAVHKGGFVFESDVPAAAETPSGQQQLFKAA